MARSTLASSSTSSSVSAMMSLERGSDQHRERPRQQPRLERRLARQLTVELHKPRRIIRYLDAHRADTRPPDAPPLPLALAVPEQQLDHRARALKRTVSFERDDVQPAVIGGEIVAQIEKPGRQLAAVQHQQHGRADFV